MSSSSRSVHGGGGSRDAPAQHTTLSIISKPSASGSCAFKIEGYSKTRARIGVGNSITSDVFVVGGHRWQLKYYPDGSVSGANGWISMALLLVDTYAAKVEVRATFRLLHDDSKPSGSGSDRDIIYTTLTKNCSLWATNFTTETELVKSGYLKDDSFKVMCDIALSKFVAVPPSDMRHQYGELLSSGKGADVMFEVGGETFSAHRCVLAARSSVFMAELFGPMKEHTAARVRIDDMDARVFRAMLDFIYTDELPEIDDEEAMEMTQHLLVAADRYDLERLKLICENNLCNYINTKTAASMLTICEQHACYGLRKACFKFLESVANLQATVVTDEFKHLKSVCPDILDQLVDNLHG
jgi:speckle-type POZ protein